MFCHTALRRAPSLHARNPRRHPRGLRARKSLQQLQLRNPPRHHRMNHRVVSRPAIIAPLTFLRQQSQITPHLCSPRAILGNLHRPASVLLPRPTFLQQLQLPPASGGLARRLLAQIRPWSAPLASPSSKAPSCSRARGLALGARPWAAVSGIRPEG